MQRDANGSSNSVITEGNSLHTDLASLCYSDSVNMQSQNHGFPELMQSQHFSTVLESFPLPPEMENQEKLSSLTPFGANSPFEAVGYSFRGLPPTGSRHLDEWQAGFKSNGQCSEMGSSVVNSYSCSSSYNNSYKPLQIWSLLSGSGFVLAMQEILAEIACYALETNEQMNYSTLSDRFSDGFPEDQSIVSRNNQLQVRESEVKKKHLLALLQLVDDRYNQCMEEIHTVTSAFHAVTELDPNLHARFALPTISLMYKSLRDRISSHILAIGAAHLIEGEEGNEEKRSFMEKQWALQQLSKRDHLLWRPQRGLPEKSISVLKAWMFQNFLHPYPKDAEKHLLALRSGLTRNQVSNWFINARVRLWKPMIEEMYAETSKPMIEEMYAETSRRKARQNNEETDGNCRIRIRFENTTFTLD